MNKIEELINQYCPKGVEYKSLGMISSYAVSRIDAKELNALNYVGVDNLLPNKLGKEDSNYVPREGRFIKFCKGDILIGNIRPYLKKIWLATHDGGTNGDVLTIQIDSRDIMQPQFLYYILSSDSFFLYDMQNAKGAKMPRGNKEAVMKFQVPIPPLEVQNEIVRLLDNFTEHTAKLTAELTAELTARKKQYEYYIELLLRKESEKKIQWYKLCDIAEIGTGNSNTNEELEKGDYPFFVRSQEVRRKNTYEYDEIAIITAGDGVGVGKIFHYVEGKYALHQRAYRIHITSEKVMPKYFYHYMKNTFFKYIQKTAVNSSVTSIRRKMLDEFMVPVPQKDVQQHIIEIFSKFDSASTDLNNGILTEIEARKKQYEYYRDKLLTFKELSE